MPEQIYPPLPDPIHPTMYKFPALTLTDADVDKLRSASPRRDTAEGILLMIGGLVFVMLMAIAPALVIAAWRALL